jgi:hypothetical protein
LKKSLFFSKEKQMGQTATQPNRIINLVIIPHYRKLVKSFYFETNEEEKLQAVNFEELQQDLHELITQKTKLEEERDRIGGKFDEVQDTQNMFHFNPKKMFNQKPPRKLKHQGGSFSFNPERTFNPGRMLIINLPASTTIFINTFVKDCFTFICASDLRSL